MEIFRRRIFWPKKYEKLPNYQRLKHSYGYGISSAVRIISPISLHSQSLVQIS